MLAPREREPSHPTPGPLRHSLLGSVLVIGGTTIGLTPNCFVVRSANRGKYGNRCRN
jgi:hypothetical protein